MTNLQLVNLRTQIIETLEDVNEQLKFCLHMLQKYEDDEQANSLCHYYDGRIHSLRMIRDEIETLETMSRP